MLRLQRKLNIPSRSVEMKMSRVFENFDRRILWNSDRSYVICFNGGIRN